MTKRTMSEGLSAVDISDQVGGFVSKGKDEPIVTGVDV